MEYKEQLNKNMELVFDNEFIKLVSNIIYTGYLEISPLNIKFTNTDNKPFYLSELNISNNKILRGNIYIRNIYINIEINTCWSYTKSQLAYVLELEINKKYNRMEAKKYNKILNEMYDDLWAYIENIYSKMQEIIKYMGA